MALTEKDVTIIVQNAGTTAAALLGQLPDHLTTEEGASLFSDLRRAIAEDALALVSELAPEAPQGNYSSAQDAVVKAFPGAQAQGDGKACPKCGGEMWDNRADKAAGRANPKAPDFKCKDKENCDGVIWPPRR